MAARDKVRFMFDANERQEQLKDCSGVKRARQIPLLLKLVCLKLALWFLKRQR